MGENSEIQSGRGSGVRCGISASLRRINHQPKIDMEIIC